MSKLQFEQDIRYSRETWQKKSSLNKTRDISPSLEALKFLWNSKQIKLSNSHHDMHFCLHVSMKYLKIALYLNKDISKGLLITGITKQNISIIEYTGDIWPFPNHIRILQYYSIHTANIGERSREQKQTQMFDIN